jgi:phosphoribosylaminoimidazole-succinocarboxamide synthase
MKTISDTDLPLKIFKRGKVRDIYGINDKLLLVVSDRISAFDFVLQDPIPMKGICLTQLSAFWFNFFKNKVPNHLISINVPDFPKELQPFEDILFARSMLVKKTEVFPIECIIRGYISGSAWKSYKTDETVCGISLPSGLKESEKFDEPLFTPSTKADTGHDINISFHDMEKIVGKQNAMKLRKLSIDIYNSAAEYAIERGIIIADTKFEFGLYKDEIILVDEVLTPDSSRFWSADLYKPGRSQSSFDKQYVRDYLTKIGWNKNSNPPRLPRDVIIETQRKYQEAYERLTGKIFLFDHETL